MRKLFPTQYWLTWLGAAILLGLLLPYGMFGPERIPPVYPWFCAVLTVLNVLTIRAAVLQIWVRQLYETHARVYWWALLLLSFCYLVFVRMNPAGWWCIGVSAVLWGYLTVLQWRER